MLSEARTSTRERVRQCRQSEAPKPAVTRYKAVTSDVVTNDDGASVSTASPRDGGLSSTREAEGSHGTSPHEAGAAVAPSDPLLSSTLSQDPEKRGESCEYEGPSAKPGPAMTDPVTRYELVTRDAVTEYENVRNALVPTSTSINRDLGISLSSYKPDPLTVVSVRARARSRTRDDRHFLPVSDRCRDRSGCRRSAWCEARAGAVTSGWKRQTRKPQLAYSRKAT